jgi:hypothetical protein
VGRAKKKPPPPIQEVFASRRLRAPENLRDLLHDVHGAVRDDAASEGVAQLYGDGMAVVEHVAWLREKAGCSDAASCRKTVLRFLDALDCDFFEVRADGTAWTADRDRARRFRLLYEFEIPGRWWGLTLPDEDGIRAGGSRAPRRTSRRG